MKHITTAFTFGLALAAALAATAAGAQKYALPAGAYHLSVTPGTSDPQPEGQAAGAIKDDLFAGTSIFAKGATDVTEITMDPDSLGMVKGKDGAHARNLLLSVVHTYSYDKPGMYRMEDVEPFRQKLSTGDWHCSVHVREEKRGESTDICSKHRTDGLSESAIITVEPKQLTFIHTIHRGGEGDHSGLDDMIILNGHIMGPAALAHLDGQFAPAFATLHANLDSMPDMADMQAKLQAAMKNMPKLDTAQMQRQMADMQKKFNKSMKNMPSLDKLDSPEMQQQMKDLQQKLDDARAQHLFDMPGMQRNLDDLLAHPPAPAAPPAVPPAPRAAPPAAPAPLPQP